MDKGVFDKGQEYSMYSSYLGGMLRSIRFGINEAHGGGVAIQWNYYFEKGAFYVDGSGKLTFDENKIFPAVTSLARELLLIEARGDYDGANNFIQRYRQMTPEMKDAVEKLEHVPTDIRPIFPVVDRLWGKFSFVVQALACQPAWRLNYKLECAMHLVFLEWANK